MTFAMRLFQPSFGQHKTNLLTVQISNNYGNIGDLSNPKSKQKNKIKFDVCYKFDAFFPLVIKLDQNITL